MSRRKKAAPKRIRRSPYERSLEYATKRLEKALAEQMHHQACLEALNKEIPYLQTVIRALTPNDEQSVEYSYKVRNSKTGEVRPLVANANQEEFLKRFVKPVPMTADKPVSQEGVVTDQSEPFIPDIVPGEEILP